MAASISRQTQVNGIVLTNYLAVFPAMRYVTRLTIA
jgi:hypothetical protein